MSSLAGRVVGTALAVLCATLVLVGLVTAWRLQVRTAQDLDQALLAAAFAEAHPWQDERFRNDHADTPVNVRPWRDGDPLVPRDLHDEAIAREVPMLVDRDGRRVLLLAVDRAAPRTPEDEEHGHFLVVAEAPRITLQDAALPFLAIYSVVAFFSLVVAAFLLSVGMLQALEPLTRATQQLHAVTGLGAGVRLPLAGVDEVDALLGSTNALLERLEAAFDSQAAFTAQAAHELRTPVTIVKGELELALRRERTPEAYRETLARASDEVERLAELVEGLMLLARVDAGQADRGRQVERLSEALHRALKTEARTLDQAGCTVTIVQTADPEIRQHVPLVATAIGNLLRNAAVHATGTPVDIELGDDGTHAWVEVRDGGPGLADADRTRVLERFQRGSTRRDGLGLGLPLSREIARRHGGDLVLSARPSGGLVARLTLSSDSNPAPSQAQPTAP